MLGAAVVGNVIYRGETEVTGLRSGSALLWCLLLGFLLFVYMLVPLLLRAFLLAQLRIGNTGLPTHPVAAVSRADRLLLVWGIWTLGLAIGLPFAFHDWRQSYNPPTQEQGP
jgi:hypothetical protein